MEEAVSRPRITVGHKLSLLAGTGLVVAGTIGLVSYASMGTVRSTSDLRTVLNKANAVLIDLDMQESNVQIAERDELLAVTKTTQQAAKDELAGVEKSAHADWAVLLSIDVPAAIKADLSALGRQYDTYLSDVTARMPVLQKINPGTPVAAEALKAEASRAIEMEGPITATRQRIQARIDAARAASDSAMNRLQAVIVIAGVVGFFVLVAASLLIARSITGPLKRMVAALARVAARDLTTSVDVTSRDEIGDMARALDEALTAMREAIGTVAETSSALSGASTALTAVATQLSPPAIAMYCLPFTEKLIGVLEMPVPRLNDQSFLPVAASSAHALPSTSPPNSSSPPVDINEAMFTELVG